MEATKNTSAIVLNRQPYRESDSLITVYTPDFGKLVLVARGTKKPRSKLAGHVEPLNHIDLMIISGRGFDYVGSALARNAYQGIKGDLNKLFFAGRALSVFDRLIKENQADQRLFFLLLDWLDQLENYPAPEFSRFSGELLFNFLTLKLLAELGYNPQMQECLDCQGKIVAGQNYFDLKNGGLICAECLKARQEDSTGILTISDDCIKLWRFMADNSFALAPKLKINQKLVKELSNLINGFLSFRD
ncbi:MAG: DNA repair protein RecO [Patescibacteria group bacterium]|jgi:DNA repair protein RecO (recombination protein O)